MPKEMIHSSSFCFSTGKYVVSLYRCVLFVLTIIALFLNDGMRGSKKD